jgi:hypothetical protein
MDNVCGWLEKLNPPWVVYIYPITGTVEKTVQMLGALEYQSWGLMFLRPEHREEMFLTDFPVFEYLDSRLRVPWWDMKRLRDGDL